MTDNMSCHPRRQKWLRYLIACLLCLSLLPAAHAGYLLAKANLAQWLIARVWQEQTPATSPARPWPWADTGPVARLQINRLAYDAWVLNGASGRTLAFGPGLAQGSALPGTRGVTIIGGHRDSHFTVLKDLVMGDQLRLQSADKQWRGYTIDRISVADSRYDAISLESDHDRLVLVTCYPFDALQAGGPLRYVVEARATGRQSEVRFDS
jgi:sortase A